MERRRHDRIQVILNAVLIGEKTVPKGCKVHNLSQHGVLLKCISDGRESTIREGNKVTVHLLLQQAGHYSYLTKTAGVRHAGNGRIGVEFNEPDARLVTLVRPGQDAMIDDAQTAPVDPYGPAMQAGATGYTANIASTDDGDPAGADIPPRQGIPPGHSEQNRHGHRTMLYSSLALMVLATGLVIAAYLYATQINTRISVLESVTESHTSELAQMQEWALPASMLEGKFAYLNAQLKALTDSFVKLEKRLASGTGTLPVQIVARMDTPPAAGARAAPPPTSQNGAGTQEVTTAASEPSPVQPVVTADTAPGAAQTSLTPMPRGDTGTQEVMTAAFEPSPVQPVATADTAAGAAQASLTPAPLGGTGTQELPAATLEETVAGMEPAETPAVPDSDTSTGPWIVNLISSPVRREAERFAERARQHDIAVKQVSAQVKGREYWRIQLDGFPSRSAAMDAAEPVKNSLGLKDVWIYRIK